MSSVTRIPKATLVNPVLCEIAELAHSHLLAPKWLLAPSIRAGNQWLEQIARTGEALVGFRVLTLPHLARDLAIGRLAAEKVIKLPAFAGTLLIDRLLGEQEGEYLKQSENSAGLAGAILSAIDEVRLAGVGTADLDRISFEVQGKGGDLRRLLAAYETEMANLSVTDHAGILQLAIDHLQSADFTLPDGLLLIEPDSIEPRGLEARLLDLFPADVRKRIPSTTLPTANNNIERLRFLHQPAEATPPREDAAVDLFAAVGEVNEVREVLRRLLSDAIPFDHAEVLHTDYATYVPLIYEMAAGLAAAHPADTEAPLSVPVTFAEGIPAHYGRPGRALAAWLHWMREDFDQSLLVRMLHEGLLQIEGEGASRSGTTTALRTLPIGHSADRYLGKIDWQIAALDQKITAAQIAAAQEEQGEEDQQGRQQRSERERENLAALRQLVERLLQLSQVQTGIDLLASAATFLSELAYGRTEIDNYARDGLLTDIRSMTRWLPQLGEPTKAQMAAQLESLAERKRILGSGPRPGKLHVAHVLTGGHSGRGQTFVLGLDDGRFPGHATQDPILLDSEREQLSEALARSGEVVERSVQDFIRTLSRTGPQLTLSYPCWDLADDRERFPSPLFLAAYRINTGHNEADQEEVQTALHPPCSFVGSDTVLDETEWWLAQLCGPRLIKDAEKSLFTRYGHLGSGRLAAAARQGETFTEYDGCVPQAGPALDPRTANATVSASGLETAGACPLRYFFRYGLGIKRLEELEVDPDRWLDPLDFGSLLHEVFEAFLTDLVAAGKMPDRKSDQQPLLAELEKRIAIYRDRVPPPSEAAFLRQRQELETAARVFLDVETDYCRTHRPEVFETSVGLPLEGPGTRLDRLEPAEINLPSGGSFRTRGQIDRIDQMAANRFSICDYKTGSTYKFDKQSPFQQGRVVQNALYMAMIEPILKEHYGPAAEAAEFNYFFPSQKVWGRRIGWTREELAEGLPTIDRLCQLIATGAFVPTDNEKDCGYCDYAAACGDTKALTVASKTKIHHEDNPLLVPIRELRPKKKRGKK